jgi:hypothetical protein
MTSTRNLPVSGGNPDMARASESGVTEVQRPEQGLRVLARVIARVYARDTRLASNLEVEHVIPCYGGTEVSHSQMEKAQVKKGR